MAFGKGRRRPRPLWTGSDLVESKGVEEDARIKAELTRPMEPEAARRLREFWERRGTLYVQAPWPFAEGASA